jgi:thioredoxin
MAYFAMLTYQIKTTLMKEVLYFSAPWCGPCKMFGPIFDDVASTYADTVKFTKINVDDEYHITAKYNVRSVPTVVVVDGEGNALQRSVGTIPTEKLVALFSE